MQDNTTSEATDREKLILNIAKRLESGMRRYLYDKTPERRLICIQKFEKELQDALKGAA